MMGTTEEDVVAAICKRSLKFAGIPATHQWPVLLRAIGNSTEVASAVCGEPEEEVDKLWSRYRDLVDVITPVDKVMVWQIMALNGIGPLVSDLYSNIKNTEKKAGVAAAKDVGELVIVLKRLEKELRDSKRDVDMSITDFGESLGKEKDGERT
jgi:hypothetical protein